MTREEIMDRLLEYLDQQLKEVRGYIGQEPNTRDFFKLFNDAYRQGYFEPVPKFRADNIRDTLLTRWEDRTPGQEEKKLVLIDRWSDKWTEWRYALDNYR